VEQSLAGGDRRHLRPSLALLPAPLFRAFLSLKPDGGTSLAFMIVSGEMRFHTQRRKMISEISCLSYNALQGPRMPTVLCYVLCLTFVSGFDSHTLPPKQKTFSWPCALLALR